MSDNIDISNVNTKMLKAYNVFVNDLTSLRTGRANIKMLDIVKVDVYGQKMPINQLATITVPEPRLIAIQVWDKSNVSLVDAAIQKSNLGINPQINGQLMRLPIPDLTEERRIELKKMMKELSEKSKISIRNIRREGNDNLKKQNQNKEISDDQLKEYEKKVQDVTDQHITLVENKLKEKEKEIMEI
ncbi:MAG: ribosome recycling factor [Candidatus Pelagibacter sp. TMED64]|nr:ribosome recycling factor [Candidatus Pelagibacter sp.]OUU67974.1 MAG: ribosome recycling factor [Candidatus Pelagibacter sp. TMED64]|tara:strand:+ start:2965 stop:3525 length:561 start_codon:yes stop_codon:yes gene_type:complete